MCFFSPPKERKKSLHNGYETWAEATPHKNKKNTDAAAHRTLQMPLPPVGATHSPRGRGDVLCYKNILRHYHESMASSQDFGIILPGCPEVKKKATGLVPEAAHWIRIPETGTEPHVGFT
jgi:hypothetical protein